jgi:hypothetical protein
MSRLSPVSENSFRGNDAGAQTAECAPPLITRILSQERFLGDGPPNWSGAPTAKDAKAARDRSVKRLRRFSPQFPDASHLAETLASCERQCRCMSGACPECSRAFQRWFVSEVERLVGKSDADNLQCVSVIFQARRTTPGDLMDVDSTGLKRSFSATTEKTNGVNWIVGGIDLSLNDDRQKRQGLAWQPQIYALAEGNLNTLAKRLREKFGTHEPLSRPVQIKRCDGSAEAVSYAFKTEFVQRIAYKAELSHRQCWSTRKVSLPPVRHVQAMIWMHRQGLQGRLFLHRVRMTRVGNGVALVQIKKRE